MNPGKWKVWFDRWQTYVSKVSTLVSFATFFVVSGVSWWWIVPVLALSILFMVFVDIPHIYPKEQEYNCTINPFMRELMERAKNEKT